MDRGQRAVLIVGMLSEASEAIVADADVEQVICRHLAEGVQADAAVCFVPGADGGRVLGGHPDRTIASVLAQSLDDADFASASQAPLQVRAVGLGHVLVVAPPLLELAEDGTERRALAFSRADGFDEAGVLLLHEAIPPLTALMPHAIAVTERREKARAGRDAAREFGLTGRELEVLELLAQGLLATSIASRLSLSPRTVHKHLGNIYDKLGVHDRLVAVSLARGRGLVAA